MRNYRHIVITGYPRSGTSLLFNMMTACLAWGCERHEARAVRDLELPGDRISKRPYDIMELDGVVNAARQAQKDLLVCLCVRDPRDIVTSRHPMLPDRYMVAMDHTWRYSGQRGNVQAAFDGPGLRQMSLAWLQWAGLSVPVVQVKLERLVQAPDAVQDEIGAAFDVQQEYDWRFSAYSDRPATLAFQAVAPELHKHDKPVSGQWVGRWRAPEHVERIEEQRALGLDEVVAAHDYPLEDTA